MRLRPAKATFEDVVADVIELNPHLTRGELMEYVEVDAEDASRVKGRRLRWHGKGINALPESMGDLTVDGALNLDDNSLATLPESFGSLTVGGTVDLIDNPVAAYEPHFDGLNLHT